MNHYDTLGVPPDADPAAIKKAYKAAASKAHPDKDTGSKESFQAVQLAGEVLLNPERRARYDETGDDALDKSEEAALGMLLEIFSSLIEKESFAGDFIKETCSHLEDGKRNVAAALTGLRRSLVRLEKLQSRVVVNEGEVNYFANIVTQKVASVKADIAAGEETEKALESAMTMLKVYADTAPTVSGYASPFSFSMVGSAMYSTRGMGGNFR